MGSGSAMGFREPGAPKPSELPLPSDNPDLWQHVLRLRDPPDKPVVQGELHVADLEEMLAQIKQAPEVHFCGLRNALDGRTTSLTKETFMYETWPYIVQKAVALPELVQVHGRPKLLLSGKRPQDAKPKVKQARIERELGLSLLANMFIGAFDPIFDALQATLDLPRPSFSRLLAVTAPQEVAKLQMFLNFFFRVKEREGRRGGARPTALDGTITIDRVSVGALSIRDWASSTEPLLAMDMADMWVGFEEARGLAHVDFANSFIGGGVLSGGCVQEEIRFSICPELCLSMLLCEAMRPHEAIQIRGAEQFSAYKGYAFSLKFGGDCVDPTTKAPTGEPLSAVLAMDALDLRMGDSSLCNQMETENLLRELNKSFAGFTPVREESRKQVVATGNWGCGAFLGCAPLKALIQWASASQCRRQLRYFPYNQEFGPELRRLSDDAVSRGVSVGDLVSALLGIADELQPKLTPMQLLGCGARPSLDSPRSEQSVTEETLLAEVDSRLRSMSRSTDVSVPPDAGGEVGSNPPTEPLGVSGK